MPRRLPRPLQAFLSTETAGGVLLLVAAVTALAWANSPWDTAYHRLWETDGTLRLGTWTIHQDLRGWVNEGLMTLFFFVVGLEIKRELVSGELRTVRAAALPVAAAVGGMVVPAAIYLALNAGGDGSRGWGIPMATDIAFAVGVLAIVGRRVSTGLKTFLLALAIMDDIGAILVIAVFYAARVSLVALSVAVALLGVMRVLHMLGVRWIGAYVALGVAVWFATFQSGVHATIAGAALGLLAPAALFRDAVSPVARLEQLLHPLTSYVVVPLFALANAGVALGTDTLTEAATSRVTLGVIAGLVLGKPIGIALFSWLAVRARVAVLPSDVSARDLVGVGAVAGIGFTVSLFVAELALADPQVRDAAKLGILAASVMAGVVGAVFLNARRGPDTPSGTRAGYSLP